MIHALKIAEDLVGRIRAHAIEAYPHECCGALLGREGEDSREVMELAPLKNRRLDSPRNRFSISAEDVRFAEKAAGEQNLKLIGWYHSHPDSPARPSEYDREHAWPWYSYVIVRSNVSATREITSWRLTDDRTSYEPETLDVAVRASA
jgi:proteasome lid subunit RPN8/RPN11